MFFGWQHIPLGMFVNSGSGGPTGWDELGRWPESSAFTLSRVGKVSPLVSKMPLFLSIPQTQPSVLSMFIPFPLATQTGGKTETAVSEIDRDLYFGLKIFLYINEKNQNTPKMTSLASYFPV